MCSIQNSIRNSSGDEALHFFALFATFCFKGWFEQKVAKTAKGTAREANGKE